MPGGRALHALLPAFATRTGMLGGRTAGDIVSRSAGGAGHAGSWALGSERGSPGI
ncbi:hypothetical protein [Streptomyces sp. NRRL B-24484]|uniref:hypothetical protein n=1 Tax=Streptomyces sp. NRRL B-24484 TaxID=1463833 RepID=UPI000A50CDB4|nr:hypothetical protein [Streptomyces sp. NRRL B-24484]